jgi:hypothetical protein
MSSDRIQLNIRLDKNPDLYEAIKAQAQLEGISINDFAINALKASLGWETKLPSATSEQLKLELEKLLADRLAPLHQRLIEVEKQLGEFAA